MVMRGVSPVCAGGGKLLRHILNEAAAARDPEESVVGYSFVLRACAGPAWVDWARVRRGQQFLLQNFIPVANSLLYLSLIGGFAAPKTNKVCACAVVSASVRGVCVRVLVGMRAPTVPCRC